MTTKEKLNNQIATFAHMQHKQEKGELFIEKVRQVAVHRIIDSYLMQYFLEEENATVKGFLEYAAVEDELDSEEESQALAETEASLIRQLH